MDTLVTDDAPPPLSSSSALLPLSSSPTLPLSTSTSWDTFEYPNDSTASITQPMATHYSETEKLKMYPWLAQRHMKQMSSMGVHIMSFQLEDVSIMWDTLMKHRRGVPYCNEMGLGKTVVIWTLIWRLLNESNYLFGEPDGTLCKPLPGAHTMKIKKTMMTTTGADSHLLSDYKSSIPPVPLLPYITSLSNGRTMVQEVLKHAATMSAGASLQGADVPTEQAELFPSLPSRLRSNLQILIIVMNNEAVEQWVRILSQFVPSLAQHVCTATRALRVDSPVKSIQHRILVTTHAQVRAAHAIQSPGPEHDGVHEDAKIDSLPSNGTVDGTMDPTLVHESPSLPMDSKVQVSDDATAHANDADDTSHRDSTGGRRGRGRGRSRGRGRGRGARRSTSSTATVRTGWLWQRSWKMVIVDEAHAIGRQRLADALISLRYNVGYILSGSPQAHGWTDWAPLFEFVYQPVPSYPWSVREWWIEQCRMKNMPLLRNIIRTHVIMRTRQDTLRNTHLAIPDPIRESTDLHLTSRQMQYIRSYLACCKYQFGKIEINMTGAAIGSARDAFNALFGRSSGQTVSDAGLGGGASCYLGPSTSAIISGGPLPSCDEVASDVAAELKKWYNKAKSALSGSSTTRKSVVPAPGAESAAAVVQVPPCMEAASTTKKMKKTKKKKKPKKRRGAIGDDDDDDEEDDDDSDEEDDIDDMADPADGSGTEQVKDHGKDMTILQLIQFMWLAEISPDLVVESRHKRVIRAGTRTTTTLITTAKATASLPRPRTSAQGTRPKVLKPDTEAKYFEEETVHLIPKTLLQQWRQRGVREMTRDSCYLTHLVGYIGQHVFKHHGQVIEPILIYSVRVRVLVLVKYILEYWFAVAHQHHHTSTVNGTTTEFTEIGLSTAGSDSQDSSSSISPMTWKTQARLKASIPILHGGTSLPTKRRSQYVKDFQNGKYPIFLVSLKCANSSIDLTAARHLYTLGFWWNPLIEKQAECRAVRATQRYAVHLVRPYAKDRECVSSVILNYQRLKLEAVEQSMGRSDVNMDTNLDILRFMTIWDWYRELEKRLGSSTLPEHIRDADSIQNVIYQAKHDPTQLKLSTGSWGASTAPHSVSSSVATSTAVSLYFPSILSTNGTSVAPKSTVASSTALVSMTHPTNATTPTTGTAIANVEQQLQGLFPDLAPPPPTVPKRETKLAAKKRKRAGAASTTSSARATTDKYNRTLQTKSTMKHHKAATSTLAPSAYTNGTTGYDDDNSFGMLSRHVDRRKKKKQRKLDDAARKTSNSDAADDDEVCILYTKPGTSNVRTGAVAPVNISRSIPTFLLGAVSTTKATSRQTATALRTTSTTPSASSSPVSALTQAPLVPVTSASSIMEAQSQPPPLEPDPAFVI